MGETGLRCYGEIPARLARGQVLEVKVPGSCGELAQGMVGTEHFLITCPIGIYARAALRPGRPPAVLGGVKVQEAVRRTLRLLGCQGLPGELEVHSSLPVGKGMASSSADIAAACQAAALAHGRTLSPQQRISLAVGIEPTDGVFCGGIVQFDHVGGRRCLSLGAPPPMLVSVWDCGGQVDTQAFNRREDLLRLNRDKEAAVRHAVACIRRGIRRQQAAWIGRGATLSALAHQQLLPKEALERFWQLAQVQGAVGVNVAHSGTVLGALWAGTDEAPAARLAAVLAAQLPQLSLLGTWPLVAGGVWYRCGEEEMDHGWKCCL